ncbi:unnamed protein product [Trichobilharzia szidati]|nr:unnamed protein product [Trichobilharzia szidati]
MDKLERRKLQKSETEKLRRRRIRDRLIHLRFMLKLDENVSRIEILRNAVDRLKTTQSTGVYNPEYTCDRSRNISQQLEKRTPNIQLHPQVDQMKIPRATVEQYRRHLERVEYDRIRSLLGCDEKVSEIRLLDKLLIETIEDRENQNSNSNDFCKDKIIKSTRLTTLTTQNTERRQGLKLLDTNQPTRSVQYPNVNNNTDNNMDKEINESQQPCNKSFEPPSRHNESVSNIKRCWRPWEDN